MKKITYGIILIILLVGSGCVPHAIYENITVPKTDIIYQAINDRLESTIPSNNLLGFVNADGSDNIKIKLNFRPYTPIVSKNWGGVIFRINMRHPADLDEAGGPIYFLQNNGKYKVCDNFYYESFFFPIPSRNSVLVSSAYSIDLVNIDTCKIVKNLVKIPELVPMTKALGTATPSDSGKKIIFTEYFNTPTRQVIYTLDIDSGQIDEILIGGDNPSFSPDEKKIAYEGKDGIYIADSNGSNVILLVPISFPNYFDLYPHPFWSLDGTTLIYHKCNNDICKDVSDFSIYKVNVNTGVETKIIDGGLFPTWIK